MMPIASMNGGIPMSTYGDNLRSAISSTPGGERPAGQQKTPGSPDMCSRGGSHRWNSEAGHEEGRLRIDRPEQDIRIRLGSCARCGDVLVSITSFYDPNWELHQQLISVRDMRAA